MAQLSTKRGFPGLRAWMVGLLVVLAVVVVVGSLFGVGKAAIWSPVGKETVQVKVKTYEVRVTCQPSGLPPTAAGCPE